MYNNPVTRWTSVNVGPKRDIVGELLKATRAEGLKTAVSSHRAFNRAYFFRTGDSDNLNPEFLDLYSAPQPYLFPGKGDEIFQKEHRHTWGWDEAFRRDWLARTADLIDSYKPDIIWFDFGIGRDKNGVMLLNIGPKPDGSIPEEEQGMLREIGGWLKTNGEGIYSSRPWKTFGGSSFTYAEGSHQKHTQKGYA